VIDVQYAGPRRLALGDLVGVVGGRQPGADVKELGDARVAAVRPSQP